MGIVVDELELLWLVADRAEKLLEHRLVPGDALTVGCVDALTEAVHNLRHYQQHAHEAVSVEAQVRPCNHCGANIFFAQRPSHAWLPMEVDKVPVEKMPPAWRWVVDFTGQVPTVLANPNATRGEVWVNHHATCGSGEGPKHRVEVLVRRWRVNQERMRIHHSEVIESLRAMSARYSQRPLDADER